jgi:hypothetical protein
MALLCRAWRSKLFQATHLQWDFDDVDPIFPLSPLFRFEHKFNPELLPAPFKVTPAAPPAAARGALTADARAAGEPRVAHNDGARDDAGRDLHRGFPPPLY